ncbi:Glucokinase [hydrothermal vent metagenome]|uniref:Glucokinase n=1 Tax=hydrothermal vent metagenome TaxID=652676 RepID=A0A3B1E3Q9_9ZZZZ
MGKVTVGIDIGGTNIKMGLVDASGKIIEQISIVTESCAQNKKKLIKAVIDGIDELLEEKALTRKDIEGVGVGVPGLVNPEKGIVTFLPNIPGWKNVPLSKLMRDELKVPVFIDNDVNLVTLAEWKFGAGKGGKNLMCMTLGTGVGSGLILNGELYRGEGFVAGELGHMPLNEKGLSCNCGGEACFERYVGNRYLMAKAGKIFKNKHIQLPDVYALAEQGNVRAVQFWEEVGTHIGNAFVGVINLLNPSSIIIGGGVSNNYKYLNKAINSVIKRRAMKVPASMVKIVRAKLGDEAGIIGAQVLVKESSAYGYKK